MVFFFFEPMANLMRILIRRMEEPSVDVFLPSPPRMPVVASLRPPAFFITAQSTSRLGITSNPTSPAYRCNSPSAGTLDGRSCTMPQSFKIPAPCEDFCSSQGFRCSAADRYPRQRSPKATLRRGGYVYRTRVLMIHSRGRASVQLAQKSGGTPLPL